MNSNGHMAVQRTWRLLPKVRMDKVVKGARGPQEIPRPSVIQVVPCISMDNVDDMRDENVSNISSREKFDESKNVNITGNRSNPGKKTRQNSNLRSPRTVPIILTSKLNDNPDEDEGDNISVYSRIMSARSNPGTPSPRMHRNGSHRRRHNHDSSEEDDKVDAMSRLSLDDDNHRPHAVTLAPPKFTRVFSVGGELNNIIKSSNNSSKISRSISR